MVNPLYSVSAATFAGVLLVILIHDLMVHKKTNKVERSFLVFLGWIVFFCVQDAFWGICGGPSAKSNELFFISSSIFHLSTIISTVFWLNYILFYLEVPKKRKHIYFAFNCLFLFLQVLMVVWNFFEPILFIIRDVQYIPLEFRIFAFVNQYVFYFGVGVVSFIFMCITKTEKRKKFRTVLIFSLAPIASGVFQFLDPNGPYYSLGYFLCCFVIHMFVVSEDRQKLDELQKEAEIIKEREKANIDALTGLINRKGYEEDLAFYPDYPPEEDFCFVSIDVIGLKSVNDSLGHHAGDELLKGAAECITQALGSYGRVYRTGGDEFACIIFASDEALINIKRDLTELAENYQGEFVHAVPLSVGYAKRKEFPTKTVKEIAKEADSRMYREKAAYYSRHGIDRRRTQAAFNAICETYQKILKVNLSNDSYMIIRADEDEMMEEKGFSPNISTWLVNFAKSGYIHVDDIIPYLKKVDLNTIRAYFKAGHKSYSLFYHRKYKDVYRLTKMEMIPAEDYLEDHETIYLYVKDVDREG